MTLDVNITARMINAVDQTSYPYTADPSFIPYRTQIQIVFDNDLVSRDLLSDQASILFGPDITLYSPITNSLRYTQTEVNEPTVQSFDFSSTEAGSYIDFGQFSSQYLTPNDVVAYSWGLLSPTTDPRYPPLADPGSYGTSDLMAFLGQLQTDGTAFYYAEMSYEMTISPNYYPYADWYIGSATLTSISSADTPEPETLFSVASVLIAIGIIERRRC